MNTFQELIEVRTERLMWLKCYSCEIVVKAAISLSEKSYRNSNHKCEFSPSSSFLFLLYSIFSQEQFMGFLKETQLKFGGQFDFIQFIQRVDMLLLEILRNQNHQIFFNLQENILILLGRGIYTHSTGNSNKTLEPN